MTIHNSQIDLNLLAKTIRPNASASVDLLAKTIRPNASASVDLLERAPASPPATSSYSTAVLADSPAVYLKCQEAAGSTTLSDSSGNSRNATLTGDVFTDSRGVLPSPDGLGKHIRFGGTNGHVTLDTSNWFSPSTSGYTFEAWINPEIYAADTRFYDFANAASTNDVFFGCASATTFNTQSGGTAVTTPSVPPLTEWHHIAVTVSAAGLTNVYLNGALLGTGAASAPGGSTRSLKYIGRSSFPAHPYFTGNMSHIAVYNTALTQSQIVAHVRAASPTASDYYHTVKSDRAWGFWPLIESSNPFEDHSNYVTQYSRNASLTGTLSAVQQSGPQTGASSISFASNTSSYLSLANATSPTTWQAATYEAWVYLAANPSASCSVISHGSTTTGTGNTQATGVWIGTNGKVNFSVYNSTATTITSSSALTLNQWNHIVATWAPNGAMDIRVNKVSQASGTKAILTHTQNLYIRAGYNHGGGIVRISNVAVYQGALSTAVTDSHYDETQFYGIVGTQVEGLRTYPAAGSFAAYWKRPIAVDTYEYRIDGGTPISTADASPWLIDTSLSVADHTFELRVKAGPDYSDWTDPVTLPATASYTYVREVLKDNPIAYLPLDSSSGQYDSWPRGIKSTPETGVSRTVNAIARNSVFAASGSGSSYISSTLSNYTPAPSGTDFTLEGWFRVPANSMPAGVIASAGTGSSGYGFGISYPSSGDLFVRTHDNAWGLGYNLPRPLSDTIYHFALVRTVSGGLSFYHLYLNGELVGERTSSIADTIGFPNGSFRVGAGINNTDFPLSSNTVVDNVAFYNTALSLERIRIHYTAGHILAAPKNVTAYQLDEGVFAIHDKVHGAEYTEFTLDNGATYYTPTYKTAIVDDHPALYYRMGEAVGVLAEDSARGSEDDDVTDDVTNVSWSSDGYNGIVNWIGTLGGTAPYVNPSGSKITATSSTYLNSANMAEKAIDHGNINPGNFCTAAGDSAQWLMIDFGSSRTVIPTRFGIQASGSWAGALPRNFNLEGSNDGSSWDILYTSVNDGPAFNSWWSAGVATSNEYRYLRIRKTGATSSIDNYLVLGDIEFWGQILTKTADNYTATWTSNGFNGLINAIGTNNGESSYVNPAGTLVTVSQSSNIDAERIASEALDHDLGESTGTSHTGNDTNSWWRIDFGPSKRCSPSRVGIVGRTMQYSSNGYHPRNFQIQGSNDSTTWTSLLTVSNDGPNSGTWWSSAIAETSAYRYIQIYTTGDTSHGERYLVLGDVEFWGEIIDISQTTNAIYSGSYALDQTSALVSVTDPDKSFYTPGNGGATLAHSSYPITNMSYISAEAWIKPDDLTGYKCIVSKLNFDVAASSTAWSWSLHLNGSALEATVYTTSGDTYTASSTETGITVSTSEWQHVAFSSDGKYLRLFINGIYAGQAVQHITTAKTLATAAGADLKIGLNSSTSYHYKGYIDEVAIYPYPLSREQCSRHYQAGRGRFASTAHIEGLTNGAPVSVKARVGNRYVPAPTALSTGSTTTPSDTQQVILVDRFDRRYSPAHPGHPDWGPAPYTIRGPDTSIHQPHITQEGRLAGNLAGASSVVTAAVPTSPNVDVRYTVVEPAVGDRWMGVTVRSTAHDTGIDLSQQATSPSRKTVIWASAFPGQPDLAVSTAVSTAGDLMRLVAYEDVIAVYRNSSLLMVGVDSNYSDNPAYAASVMTGAMVRRGTNTCLDNLVIYNNPSQSDITTLFGQDAFLYKGRLTHEDDAPNYQP